MGTNDISQTNGNALAHNKEKDLRQKTEVKLAASEEIFSLLVEAVDEYAIFALDPTGHILTWNSGAHRLKGYTADEIIGSHIRKFYLKADVDRKHPEHELELAEKNGKYEEEGWRVRKDGTTFWAYVVITALRDKEGVLRGFGKVTRDLSKKREAELLLKESEERFRLVVSNVTDYAIITLDTKGYVTSWNTGAERIKLYKPSEIIGKHFSVFYPSSEVAKGKPEIELRIATDEGRYEEEGWRVRKDGTMFWANVSVTAMRDEKTGELRGFAKVTRDLTERKKAEEALKEANVNLEARVKERTKELNESRLRAEEAVKARDQFFSMASHELKTPLSSLKMQVQLRKRKLSKGDFSDFSPEKLNELCRDDERQILRLAELVDRMLDISKLSTGRFELALEVVELTELVNETYKRIEPILKESGNELSVTTTQKVKGTWDKLRIEQVLSNLLTNAAKYAPGKPIEIEIDADEKFVTMKVTDHGKGIEKADQEKIFGLFEQLDVKNKASGLGLGLYISKRIIEAHQGSIRVESEPGKYCTFIIELPLHLKQESGK